MILESNTFSKDNVNNVNVTESDSDHVYSGGMSVGGTVSPCLFMTATLH